MREELFNAITNLSKDDSVRITKELLKHGEDPEEILEISRAAMQVIGDRFETGEYFLPELIVSGDILEKIADEVKPFLIKSKVKEKLGKIVLGTVKGDIHDIAKNIVVFMLDVNGFEVIDLGVDVPAEEFIKAIKEHQAKIVGLSGFLTLAIPQMKETISEIRKAGLTDVQIMIGGGPVNQFVCDDTKADSWGANAIEAVAIAKKWVGESE